MSEPGTLRIGIVCYPTHGGSGMVATELAHALAERGHEVHVITYRQPARLDSLKPGVFFHPVPVPDYPLFDYPPYSLALATRISEVICEYHLDILHVHYAIPHALAGWVAKIIAGREDLPLITTLHGTDITIVGNDPSYLQATRFSIEKSDAVTVVSRWLGSQVKEIIGCRCDTNVIYNFVDTDRYHPDHPSRLCDRLGEVKKPILLHMSNFRPVKRVRDVVDIFLHVRREMDVFLVMVGDGPERVAAEARLHDAERSGEVLFLGTRDDAESILPCADLFLMPSTAESFGLAALEAMACGVPVIGTNAGGLPEVVVDGETGFLHQVGDVEGMARSALRLLADRDLYDAFSLSARRVACERFPREAAVDRYEELYRRSLAAAGTGETENTPDSGTPCDALEKEQLRARGRKTPGAPTINGLGVSSKKK